MLSIRHTSEDNSGISLIRLSMKEQRMGNSYYIPKLGTRRTEEVDKKKEILATQKNDILD
jgi:hypothetical protein